MNFYLQISLMAIMGISFAFYSLYSSETMNMGESAYALFNNEEDSNYLETANSHERYAIATKDITLWADNMSKQRDVFIQANLVAIPDNLKGHAYSVNFEVVPTDISSAKIYSLFPSVAGNFVKYDSSVNSVKGFLKEASSKALGASGLDVMVVYPIDFYKNGKAVYVVTYW